MKESDLNDVRQRWMAPTVAILVSVFIDVVSKYLAEVTLAHGRQISIAGGDITLHLLFNKGASLGVGSSVPVVISMLVIIGSIALVLWSYSSPSLLLRVSTGLAAGGSLGNLLDRLFRSPGPFRGGVIDWITLFHQNVVFNLADVFIRVGLGIAIITILFGKQFRSRRWDGSSLNLEVQGIERH